MLPRENVASSNLASVGYDEDSETLEIEFVNGSVYQYYGVPKFMYDNLQSAPSKGKFFSHNIRNAYPYSRIG